MADALGEADFKKKPLPRRDLDADPSLVTITWSFRLTWQRQAVSMQRAMRKGRSRQQRSNPVGNLG